jgi:hypothetical protein
MKMKIMVHKMYTSLSTLNVVSQATTEKRKREEKTWTMENTMKENDESFHPHLSPFPHVNTFHTNDELVGRHVLYFKKERKQCQKGTTPCTCIQE